MKRTTLLNELKIDSINSDLYYDHHIIVTGTGRAGTTVLMQLLTELDLDTGYKNKEYDIYENCNGGMSWDFNPINAPYIIKIVRIERELENIISGLKIDHAIIPIRDVYQAAESRRNVQWRSSENSSLNIIVPGGLFDTVQPWRQEFVLESLMYQLGLLLARYEIPATFIEFPKFIHDPAYLYRTLNFLLGDIEYDLFEATFTKVVRPELVHYFVKEV